MSRKNFCLVFVLFLLISWESIAQQVLEKKYPLPAAKRPLVDFLMEIERTDNVRFFFREDWLKPFFIGGEPGQQTLTEILTGILAESEISFVSPQPTLIIFFKDQSRDMERRNIILSARYSDKSVESYSFGKLSSYVAGKKLTFRGVVVDEVTKEPMPGATVYVNELESGVTTDAGGAFLLTINGGTYLISVRSVNFREKLINLELYEDANVRIVLEEEPTTLDEVVVSDMYVVNRRLGQSALKMEDLKRTPSLLGEADLIRQVQTQSGVTTASEAASGFNVRGGSVDQNLVLYDGVPIFNTAHALGFFTAFNSDAIRDVAFYKGGTPAEFGGRASSVLDLTAKEGSYEKWSAGGGIGLVASNLMVEGPLKKDTSSLIISGRASYSDWLLDLLKTKYQSIQKGSVAFYDGSVKYAYKPNRKTKITLSGYTSKDKFRLSNDTTYQWQNIAVAARYDRTITDKLFYSVGLYFGHYDYLVSDEDPATAFNLRYSIDYPSLKIDFNRNGNVHKQTFGFQATYYNFNPGDLKTNQAETNITPMKMDRERALESSIYGSNSFPITDHLSLETGLRLTMFNQIGPGKVYRYAPGQPLEPKNTVDSIMYGSGDIVKTYFGPEPRISLQYTIDLKSSIKFGYNRMYQYVHLISNSTNITPVDIWQSSNYYFKPQRADQVSAGYFRSMKENMYEFSVETYYKYMENLLDFKDGASLILNRQLETALLRGNGRAYGAELTINKLKGELTGGINYTYSRSLRQVKGPTELESVNDGKTYPSNFDQPHIINVSWRYAIAKRFYFSGTFTYHTGRPVSLPLSGFVVNGVPVSEFKDRNNFRIPDYHRADVAFILEPNYRKKKLLSGTWVFSIYNVYGRRNPYSVFFVDQGKGVLKPYQLSLIGVAVPSLSYSFKI